jgi:hypothetical protein
MGQLAEQRRHLDDTMAELRRLRDETARTLDGASPQG